MKSMFLLSCIFLAPSTPAVYLSMDLLSGSTLPADIGGISGILVNSPALVPNGVRGMALQLNGIDQEVNFGNQKHRCLGELDWYAWCYE